MRFEEIKISEIKIGERTRKDLGDIDSLAQNIRENGLLNAILVRRSNNSYMLLAGHRRLEACKSLGWDTVLAKVLNREEEGWRP